MTGNDGTIITVFVARGHSYIINVIIFSYVIQKTNCKLILFYFFKESESERLERQRDRQTDRQTENNLFHQREERERQNSAFKVNGS